VDRLKMEFSFSASAFIVSSQLIPSIFSTMTDVTVPVSRQCGIIPAHFTDIILITHLVMLFRKQLKTASFKHINWFVVNNTKWQ